MPAAHSKPVSTSEPAPKRGRNAKAPAKAKVGVFVYQGVGDNSKGAMYLTTLQNGEILRTANLKTVRPFPPAGSF